MEGFVLLGIALNLSSLEQKLNPSLSPSLSFRHVL
jgi:hypothetical protein